MRSTWWATHSHPLTYRKPLCLETTALTLNCRMPTYCFMWLLLLVYQVKLLATLFFKNFATALESLKKSWGRLNKSCFLYLVVKIIYFSLVQFPEAGSSCARYTTIYSQQGSSEFWRPSANLGNLFVTEGRTGKIHQNHLAFVQSLFRELRFMLVFFTMVYSLGGIFMTPALSVALRRF